MARPLCDDHGEHSERITKLEAQMVTMDRTSWLILAFLIGKFLKLF